LQDLTQNATTAKAIAQVRRLKALLDKYRRAYAVQQALLNLSELASTLSDMAEFYPRIHSLLNSHLTADNCYVVLLDPQTGRFSLEYHADEKDLVDIGEVQSDEFARGLTGYVVRSGKPLLCDPACFRRLLDAGEIEMQGTPSLHWLGVPLKRGQQVIGVMAVQIYQSGRLYQQHDVELLTELTVHTVTAIDRVRSRELLEQTVRERTRQLQNINHSLQREIRERSNAEQLQAALYEISELTSTDMEMAAFYRQVHQILSKLMPADNCYIALLDESGKSLSFPFYADQFSPPAPQRPLRRGFTEYVLRVGEARLINHELAELLVNQGEVIRLVQDAAGSAVPNATSWLGAPLLIEQQALGVIAVQSYQQDYLYSDNELHILKFVSEHIAVAIQRKLNQAQQKQHQDDLERKIFERTRELRQTNLFLRLQVEERKKAEEKLFFEANHDALTGLANRQMFMLQLRQKLALRSRDANLRFAVLFIDLDRFKLINDTMGHHAGDAFLIEISKRLLSTVREHDLVARQGGDEFVVLLSQLQEDSDAEDVADRIIEAVRQPMTLDGQQLYSGASVGIVHYHASYQQADAMLRDADAAMYQAKSLGRNRFVIFTESMRQQLLQELSLEQALHQAVTDRQFGVVYEPIVCSEKQHVLGFAARMQCQRQEFTDADQIYRQAEQAGVLPQIELQLLEQVLQLLASQYEPALICLPLSAQHLSNPQQFEKLQKLLQQKSHLLHRLSLGFSESALLRLTTPALACLHNLKRLGVRLSLENLGADLLPVGLLSQYSFDFVRLDAQFCRSVARQSQKRPLLDIVLQLALLYKFRLIADGVDDEQIRAQLTDAGCCYLQGKLVQQQQQHQVQESLVFLQHLA